MMSELIEKYNEDKIEDEKLFPTKYDGYYVNKIGEVYSTKQKQIKRLKPYYNKESYYRIKISNPLCSTSVHRLIADTFIHNLNPDELKYIDHVNRNKQDNRVENLRWCNNTQNQANVKKDETYKKGCTSKYMGVCWNKRGKKWEVGLRHKEKKVHIGFYHNEIEAAKAYDIAVIKYRYNDLEYHILNFDIENYLDVIANL